MNIKRTSILLMNMLLCIVNLFAQDTISTTRVVYQMIQNVDESKPPIGVFPFQLMPGVGFQTTPSGKYSSSFINMTTPLVQANSKNEKGWMYEENGISLLGNGSDKRTGGILLDPLDMAGKRKINVSWKCRTVKYGSSKNNCLQIQYLGDASMYSNLAKNEQYLGHYVPSTSSTSQKIEEYSFDFNRELWYKNSYLEKFYFRWFYCSDNSSATKQSRIAIENLVITEIINATVKEGSWEDEDTWSLGVPQVGENVIINHTVNTQTSIAVGELQIAAGKKLVLSNAANLSATDLVLHSNDLGTSEVLLDGASCSFGVQNDVTLKKSVSQKGKWYFISFPFDVQKSGVETFNVGGSYVVEDGNYLYVRYYDSERRAALGSANGNWILKEGDNMQASDLLFEANKGYLMAIDATSDTTEIVFHAASIPSFTNLKELPLDCNLHVDGHGSPHSGWQFIGNPLFHSVSQISENESLTPFLYFYNESTSNYDVCRISSFSQKIPVLGAFFVKSTDQTSVSFGAVKENDCSIFQQNTEQVQLVLQDKKHSLVDKTMFFLAENASLEFDQKEDAYKFYSMNKNCPQIASIDKNIEMAVNTLPKVTNASIPLMFYVPYSGSYSLSLDNTSSLERIELIHQKTGRVINLMDQFGVELELESGFCYDYILDIYNGTTNELVVSSDLFKVIEQDGFLLVETEDSDCQSIVNISNIQGMTLCNGFVDKNSAFCYPLNAQEKIIFVTIVSNEKVLKYKLCVQ